MNKNPNSIGCGLQSGDSIRKWRKALVAAILVTTNCVASFTDAQEAPPSAKEFRALQQKVLELEREVQALKGAKASARGQNALPPNGHEETNNQTKITGQDGVNQQTEEAKAQLAPRITLDGTGLSFVSADDNFRLRLRGYIQADGRFYLYDTAHALTDTFLLNRVRPVFEGTVFKDFDFKLMPDFGQGKAFVEDAYLDAHFQPWFSLRAGVFKAPVGLERLQSPRDLIFVERSLPTDIAPNRDIGVAAHGEFAGGVLDYEIGVFNGVRDGGSEDSDENDDKDVDARLFAHPLKLSRIAALEGLGLGVAGTAGHENGIAPAYRTIGQQTFFSFNSGVTAHGNRDRISPQGYYYWGPFGLMGEYIVSAEDVSKGTFTKGLVNSAWQATASYVLTGERASFTGVTPKRPFNPVEGRWGAVELAARAGQLHVDPNAFHNFGTGGTPIALADVTKSASQADSWGVGLNWYLNTDIKLMIDYDQTHFDGGAPHGNRPAEHALLSRIQVSW